MTLTFELAHFTVHDGEEERPARAAPGPRREITQSQADGAVQD
jgi:hypothetical protein